ncbi:uncharacterized protein [Montipora capricornis]|uniref:uncharacterized protein n=1 Tax=Montipora capricornis TaxID=246305 RepID=UPI0035F175A1
MARPRGSSKATRPRHRRRENLTSLSPEVLRLRLQALNLPITGSKADLISRLKAAVEKPCPTKQPPPGQVKKSMSVPPVQQPGAFSEAQMAAIQDTVHLSVEQALNSYSYPPVERFLGTATPNTATPTPHRQGAGTPLGLHRPLDRNLEDKILRGEYIDFTLLLPDSLSRPQVPETQLCLDDSTPGSASPLSMVRKRKPIIDNFHKWLDAYTAYVLVIVSSYPRRSLELLKYQQIISRAATKFKGLAFLSYDEQFCRRAAYDLTICWDQVDLELWTVTFSGLAKPHCLVCSSPYHSQIDCPSTDLPRQQPRNGPVCFRLNRTSGCTSSTSPFPHVCRRCRSATHSIVNCPNSVSKTT